MAETFVLVHGGGVGAWSWAAVVRQLEKLGDRALAVDLPGRGENRPDPKTITLSTHVDFVTAYIEERALDGVVLVAHSMGGLVITGVAQKIPHRIKRLIFISAFVMLDGENPMQLLKAPRETEEQGQTWKKPRSSADFMRARSVQDASPDLQDFVIAALIPEQLKVMDEPVPMKEFYRLDLPTSVIVLEDDLAIDPMRFHPFFTRRLRNPTIRSIKSGHAVMFTKPVECAQALHDLALGESIPYALR
jgi:pimeloyl-ACP methyl ester carboxylesterase